MEGLCGIHVRREFIFVGRDGDILLSPFQCDLCWLRNIMHRNLMNGKLSDKDLLIFIRKVNLDMVWLIKSHTMTCNGSNVFKGL